MTADKEKNNTTHISTPTRFHFMFFFFFFSQHSRARTTVLLYYVELHPIFCAKIHIK